MRIARKKLSQRIINAGFAFVLALSTVSASLPFVLSQTTSAVSEATVLGTGFDYLQNWTDDRHAPASVVKNANTLTMTVDGDMPQAYAGAFYRTEGRKADLPVSTESIKATLYLDPAWQNVKGVRAGIWGVTDQSPLNYPIVEFSNRNESNDQLPGVARFQVWNTVIGSWTTVSTPIAYGNNYEFEIVFNDETDKFEIFINGALVHSYAAAYGAFGQVIFNQYNSHITNNDYTVTWKNFIASNYDGIPETTLDVRTGNNNTVDALATGTVGDKFVVRGQASDDNDLSRVYVQLNKSTGGRFGGTTVHLNGTSDDWFVAYDASDLGFADGDKIRAHVAVTDTAGKSSSVGWTSYMTVDTKAPDITWNKQSDAYYGIGDDFHVRPRTLEEGTTKSVYIDEVNDNNLVWTLVNNSGRNFDTKSAHNQALWDNLSDGSHKFIAVFTDYAGNTTTSESSSFVVDREKPVVQVNLNREVWIESGDTVRSAAIPEIKATDANLDKIEVWKNGSKVKQWDNLTTTSRYAKINWLGEGTYVIKAYDKAGNQSDEFTVIIDNTPPAEPTATPTIDNGDTTSVSLTTGDATDTIYYTHDDSDPSDTSNENRIEYTGDIDLNTDLTQTIRAVAYDQAGNVSGEFAETYNEAPVITNEATVTPTTSSITLVWETDHAATSRVIYDTVSHDTLGSGPNYGYAFSTTEDIAKVTNHSVTITGLTPGTTYYFRTVSQGSPESVSAEITGLTKVPSQNGTPTFQVNTANGNAAGTATTDDAIAVLGAQTQNTPAQDDEKKDTTSASILGATATPKNVDGAWNIAGLAWYWWLLIAAAVGAAAWWLLAALRRRQGEEA